jgi:tRNA(fMet)-specific endonuclease VapC
LHADDRVVVCTIVRGEVLYGVARLPESKRRSELARKASTLFDAIICEPVPANAAEHYAAIKTQRFAAGLGMDENDLWIAASAMALGATLVSRDRDFAGVEGLTVEDWSAPT